MKNNFPTLDTYSLRDNVVTMYCKITAKQFWRPFKSFKEASLRFLLEASFYPKVPGDKIKKVILFYVIKTKFTFLRLFHFRFKLV